MMPTQLPGGPNAIHAGSNFYHCISCSQFGAAGACAKLAATNAMVEIAASMYRIRTSWELGGHHTSSNAKTENWKPRTGNQELETKNWQLFPVGKTVLSS